MIFPHTIIDNMANIIFVTSLLEQLFIKRKLGKTSFSFNEKIHLTRDITKIFRNALCVRVCARVFVCVCVFIDFNVYIKYSRRCCETVMQARTGTLQHALHINI